MDVLSVLSLAAGSFLVGLVTVAGLVAGWEWLRQREMLDQMQRDRAIYAATSPLPLATAARPLAARGLGAPAAPAVPDAPSAPGGRSADSVPAQPPAPARREGNWIETRPMVLNHAPALDDETAVLHGEPDLRLD